MDNSMDPELACEMVKLLGQELKVVRAQLRESERRASTSGGPSNGLTHERAQALIAENESLKADNAALQERIATLQDDLTQLASVKSEEDILNPLQYPDVPTSLMGAEFARLLAENEDLIREKEEASRNQEELTTLQEKYRQTKAEAHEYQEVLSELRVALSNCTEELEQSRKVSEIDFRNILKGLPYEPVESQPVLSSIQEYTGVDYTKLPKDVMDVCKGLYSINCKEVIWHPSGIALGLVIRPVFLYNPKIHGGAWTRLENNFGVGKQMDVWYLSGKSSRTSRHLGTYERVGDQGITIIATESLTRLDPNKLDYISKRTTLFPDLVPPSQAQMVQNMYKQGVIKLQCFPIRCVAYNRTFAEKLQDEYANSVQWNPPDDTTVSRKRKLGPTSTVNSTSSKKRYEPSPAT